MKGCFYEDLYDGKRGEHMVAAALKERNHTITDVSDDWYYRFNDIDFLLENSKHQTTSLEVKNDMASERTGNLFIETYNSGNERHSYKGWFFYCAAEYICFLQETAHKAHIVLFDELKEHMAAKSYRTANSSNARGYLLPLDELKQFNSYKLLEV